MNAASPQRVVRAISPKSRVSVCQLRDGTPMEIRPIRPADEKMLVRFHQTLSADSVYFRYFSVFSSGSGGHTAACCDLGGASRSPISSRIAAPAATSGHQREIAAV